MPLNPMPAPSEPEAARLPQAVAAQDTQPPEGRPETEPHLTQPCGRPPAALRLSDPIQPCMALCARPISQMLPDHMPRIARGQPASDAHTALDAHPIPRVSGDAVHAPATRPPAACRPLRRRLAAQSAATPASWTQQSAETSPAVTLRRAKHLHMSTPASPCVHAGSACFHSNQYRRCAHPPRWGRMEVHRAA